MAEQNPNARPDEQTPEQDALEKSLEELSLDELLASVKDDLARVDAMMDGPGDAAQPEQPDAPAPDASEAAEEAPKPGMQPLFEPKIPEEYADLTVDQETQPESREPEKKRPRLPSGIRVLLYVCCVLAVAVLLAVAVSAMAISSGVRPVSRASSESWGSRPRLPVSRDRASLMAAARSFSPRLTLIAPSSRRNRRISPAIFGTA